MSSLRSKVQQIVGVLIFSLVQLFVWYPVIFDCNVLVQISSKDVVYQSKKKPRDLVLDELSKFRFSPSAQMSGNVLISAAEEILSGYLHLPGYNQVRIGIPFNSSDFEKELPTWQLTYAGMIVPDILIDAYLLSGKDAYFHQAINSMLAWERFEKSQWLPKGFLWNDHAIASRISVITKFWHVYRDRQDYEIEVAKAILRMVSRGAGILAKDGQFTFSTNHGVMQNLALLHLAAAFPDIPHVAEYREIALKRLSDQMQFYISDEGVVLEHSAGYHSHGMELFGKAFRYLDLNNMTPPRGWVEKYNKSKDFMSMINRPDHSLPVFGNTSGAPNSPSFITEVDKKGKARLLFPKDDWHPIVSHALYPVAGYSVWWDELSAQPDSFVQTVIGWSYFQGHGHKLADEMSLLVWAGNQNWLTNVGYWPYGIPGRAMADSWEGSNAPHLLSEAADSIRHTELLDYMVKGRLAFNHLRRVGPADFSVDRQVLHIDSDLWLILDHHSSGSVRRVSTTWTFFHDLEITRGALPGQFHFKNVANNCMSVYFSGGKKIDIKTYKGSMQPFAGWVVYNNQIRAAPSLLSEQESIDSWSLTTLSLERDCKMRIRGSPRLIDWQNSNRWEAEIPLNAGGLKILRIGKTIYFGTETYLIGQTKVGDKYSNASIAIEQGKIANSFNAASKKYKKNKDVFPYRVWVSYLLLAIYLCQGIFFLAMFVIEKRDFYFIRIGCNGVWITGGLMLYFMYFNIY